MAFATVGLHLDAASYDENEDQYTLNRQGVSKLVYTYLL